ncbi:hypothetical protein ACOSQ2_002473 [Xanthoceras sorbifolium]
MKSGGARKMTAAKRERQGLVRGRRGKRAANKRLALKVNDAAFDSLHNRKGLGAVVRDHNDALLLAGIDYIDGLLALDIAKVKAILFDVTTACERGVSIACFESEAAWVYKSIKWKVYDFIGNWCCLRLYS